MATPMLNWQLPANTPEWHKNYDSIYLELLGADIHKVKGPKYTTRVIEMGEGEPLILLHGVGGTAESWFRNMRHAGARLPCLRYRPALPRLLEQGAGG